MATYVKSLDVVNGRIMSGSNGNPTEADLSFSDVTTLNASTSQHGFLPKLSGNAGDFLDGTGAWSTGSSGITQLTGDGTAGPGSGSQALTVLGASTYFYLSGVISAGLGGGPINDYHPVGLHTASRLRLTAVGGFYGYEKITGIDAGLDGELLIIEYLSTATTTLILSAEDTASSAANRFAFLADLTLQPGDNAVLIYDGTSARWLLLSSSSGAGGITQLTGDGTAGPGGGSQALTVLGASTLFCLSGYIGAGFGAGTMNDWYPTGLHTCVRVRMAVTGGMGTSATITGLNAGADGELVILENLNSSSWPVILTAEDAASSAANRFAINVNLTIQPGENAFLLYDGTLARWLLLSTTAGGGGGSTDATSIQGNACESGITPSLHDVMVWGASGWTAAANLTLGSVDASSYVLADGYVTSKNYLRAVPTTANTSVATYSPFILDLHSSGTPAAGFGMYTGFYSLDDDSNAIQTAGFDQVSWVNAGHTTYAARRTFHVSDHTADSEVIRIEADGSGNGKLGFFGVAAVPQQNTTGTTTGFTAGSGTAVNDDSTFTGNLGSTAYTIGDVVRALKSIGLLAS